MILWFLKLLKTSSTIRAVSKLVFLIFSFYSAVRSAKIIKILQNIKFKLNIFFLSKAINIRSATVALNWKFFSYASARREPTCSTRASRNCASNSRRWIDEETSGASFAVRGWRAYRPDRINCRIPIEIGRWPDYLSTSVIAWIATRLRPGSRNANWPITSATCTSTPCASV